MWHFGFGGVSTIPEPEFKSKMSLPPEHGVVILGAGASVSAGCPVMHSFIDCARDYKAQGLFSESETADVTIALGLHDAIRAAFSITEEDVENVETLLSLADLSKLIGKPPIQELSQPDLSNRLRRFINAVITKSVSVPSPASPEWLERKSDGPFVYKQLVRALAYNGGSVTVFTTNYDCLVEFACHCMGIPFTYNSQLANGIEILKLHGSSNWLRCPNSNCEKHKEVRVSALVHRVLNDSSFGYLETIDVSCERCGSQLTPIIIPPTWAKDIDYEAMKGTWSRARELLSKAEVLVSVGFSLPVSDAHIRHLLHVGLSAGKLRQALVVVGPGDRESAARWSSFFRESWRKVRLDVRQTSFERSVDPAVLPALVVPPYFAVHAVAHAPLLPLPLGRSPVENTLARLREAIEKLNMPAEEADKMLKGIDKIDWAHVAKNLRCGTPAGDNSIKSYRNILINAGLDWTPGDSIMPAHGSTLMLIREI